MTAAYVPSRTFVARASRRLTQWRAARPASLAFERPILSICFDDFPRSAAIDGARILEAHGGRGTYYAAAGLAEEDGPCGPGFTADDLLRLAASGHEIGCHTYTHRDCARLTAYDALGDLARNRDAIAQFGHRDALQSLAYPYGETSSAFKASLPPRFRTARGALSGLNIGRVDLAQLRAIPLYGEGMTRAWKALGEAARRNAWMIAFTHDVADPASPWGTTPEAFEYFIEAAVEAGFRLLPVTMALDQAL